MSLYWIMLWYKKKTYHESDCTVIIQHDVQSCQCAYWQNQI